MKKTIHVKRPPHWLGLVGFSIDAHIWRYQFGLQWMKYRTTTLDIIFFAIYFVDVLKLPKSYCLEVLVDG